MNKKIKNIVFDLGGVLIDFNPKKYLKILGFNEENADFFTKLVFYSEEWKKYNSSKYNLNDVKLALINKYSEYTNELNLIFNNIKWSYILYEIKEVSNYLKQLKGNGYNIYILSDLSKEHYEFNRQFDFFNYIDGGVYSFEVGSTKPNLRNYKELLNEYSLIPEETVFIDDVQINIEAALSLGINAIQFDFLDNVKEKINKLTI